MKKSLLLIGLSLLAGTVTGVWVRGTETVTGLLHPKPSPSHNPPVVEHKPPPVPESEVELLATLPDGVKIYRVKHPRMIVPSVVAVAPNGTPSIR